MKGRGSIALLLIAAAILLRPWDRQPLRRLLPDGERAAAIGASARLAGRVVRAVDGDTLEVAIDGVGAETVRLIAMLSRVSRPTLRLPAVASG